MKKYLSALAAAVAGFTVVVVASIVTAHAEESKWDDYQPSYHLHYEKTATINNEEVVEDIEEKERGRVKVNIGSATNVGKSVFEALEEKPAVRAVFSCEDYTWVFKGGAEVTTTKTQYNLGLQYSDPMDFRYEKLLADDKAKLSLVNFYTEEALPFEGEVTVKTKLRDGELAYVYIYNKEERKAEIVAEDLEVSSSGEVKIPVSTTKDMFITNKPITKSNII